MSHTVKIKTLFKDLNVFKKALEKFGWTVKENEKIRTYPSDSARNTVYKYVAVNPKQDGYDIGVGQKEDGELELFADFHDGSIAAGLGQDLQKLRQEYSKQLTIDEMTFNGYTVDESTDNNGNISLEFTKA